MTSLMWTAALKRLYRPGTADVADKELDAGIGVSSSNLLVLHSRGKEPGTTTPLT